MTDCHHNEAWNLYLGVVKERDQARAQLDTLRLVALDLMRERDQARALAHDYDYDALLTRLLTADPRAHPDLGADLDRLRHRLRRAGWLPDTPALPGDAEPAPRCPTCGLRLLPGQPCFLCGTAADQPRWQTDPVTPPASMIGTAGLATGRASQ